MAVYILEPSLTDDFIVSIFTNLVLWETKKLIGFDMERQEGCQTGYVECLADLFGESSDANITLAFDKGETWLQVVNTIMGEDELSKLIEEKSDGGLENDDFNEIEQVVTRVVEEYVVNNMDTARKAIRNI